MNSTKTCRACGMSKSINKFHKDKNKKDGRTVYCKECNKKRLRKYRENHKEEIKKSQKIWYEKIGRQQRCQVSMYENKLCPAYLGIVIGERLCRHLFKDVEVIPNNNPGFDIICNKGKKINVKTACMTLQNKKYPYWIFNIDHNTTADFFILVVFDNLTDLNPLHLWMIPGKEINDKTGAQIRPSTIHKWDEWKRSTEEVRLCCIELKTLK